MDCGTDLSRGSDAALRLAVAWARRQGESLRVVHALEGPAASLLRGSGEQADAVRHEIDAQIARAGGNDLEPAATRELLEGDAVSLLRPAPGTTLVVGAEGSSATLLRRAGHVPRTLAAELAPGARLLVAPQAWIATLLRRRRTSPPRHVALPLGERILVACSLTGHDAPRLAEAARVASDSPGTELHLVHVLDLSAARHHPVTARAAVRAATDEAAAHAEESLRELAAEAPLELAMSRPVRIHVVRQGPIERDLAGLASSQSIDLILAGPGRVAAELTGFARCPVLIS